MRKKLNEIWGGYYYCLFILVIFTCIIYSSKITITTNKMKVIEYKCSNIEAVIDFCGSAIISESHPNVHVVGHWVQTPKGDIMLSEGDIIVKKENNFFVYKMN